MVKYKITLLGFPFDTKSCPPLIVKAVFPNFDGWAVELSSDECLVTVPDSATAPADLGPLVKVEKIAEQVD